MRGENKMLKNKDIKIRKLKDSNIVKIIVIIICCLFVNSAFAFDFLKLGKKRYKKTLHEPDNINISGLYVGMPRAEAIQAIERAIKRKCKTMSPDQAVYSCSDFTLYMNADTVDFLWLSGHGGKYLVPDEFRKKVEEKLKISIPSQYLSWGITPMNGNKELIGHGFLKKYKNGEIFAIDAPSGDYVWGKPQAMRIETD